MSYWIIRDLDGTAIGIQEDMTAGIIQNNAGAWLYQIQEREHGFIIKKRPKDLGADWPIKYRVFEISQSEYETHEALGLFDE
jgi:hypothetical protein